MFSGSKIATLLLLVYCSWDEVNAGNYTQIGAEWFMVVKQNMSWTDAREHCKQNDGDLASPTNLEALRDYLREENEAHDYWLGGTDEAEEGTWTWLSGERINDSWKANQPAGGRTQNCLDFRSEYNPSLNDYECDKPQYFICESKSNITPNEAQWTAQSNGCIARHNNKIRTYISSLEDCKIECLSQHTFKCQSIEFDAWQNKCYMSDQNMASTSDFEDRCSISGLVYTEIIENISIPGPKPLGSSPVGPSPVGPSIDLEHLWTIPSGGCIIGFNDKMIEGVSNLDDCKAECVDHSNILSFVCRSIEYSDWFKQCVLSAENRFGGVTSFEETCTTGGWIYTEKFNPAANLLG